MTDQWLIGRTAVMSTLYILREQSFTKWQPHFLWFTTPSGVRRYLREYIDLLVTFLNGRQTNKKMLVEFSETDEARELAKNACKNFEAMVREHSTRGRLPLTSVSEMLCMGLAAPHTWDTVTLGYDADDDSFDTQKFLENCKWNRPGFRD